MDVRSALKSQYHAALKTLREAIELCPDSMWDDPADGPAPFWRVAYHTLFYAHFYLQQTQDDFTPWARHRDEAQFMGSVPLENSPPKPCAPYTRDDLLEYWQICDEQIDGGVDSLDLSAAQCGFPWYKMPTLEHQIVNIRHIQHHAAALSTRLRRSAGIAVRWVGSGRS
jgi:DinB superfamily